jgi:hypothetical protein
MSFGAARRRVLAASIFFILGFSFVFICFGAAASVLGQYMLEKQRLLAKIAAVIVILFGLHTMGVLRIGWLYSEKRVQVERKPTTLFGAFFVGLAFAFGWTPCIGPILGGILAIAGTQQTVGQGRAAACGLLGRPRPAVPADGARHQPVLHRLQADPAALPRHRGRLRPAARPHRRAHLHEPVHADREVADALSAYVLERN